MNNDGVRKSIGQHRLVGLAFIPKPDSNMRLIINHINGVKDDNVVTNLEWVTYSENNKHAFDFGLRKNKLWIKVYDLESKKSSEFFTFSSCMRELKVNREALERTKNDSTAIKPYEITWLSFEKHTKTKEDFYPLGICAKNIASNDLIIAETAANLSESIGVHAKVIRRILRDQKFLYPINGWDIRSFSNKINWPTYTDEEIEAYKSMKFIHQPILIINNKGESKLVGGVNVASMLTGTPERSIRFAMTHERPCVNDYCYKKYVRNVT